MISSKPTSGPAGESATIPKCPLSGNNQYQRQTTNAVFVLNPIALKCWPNCRAPDVACGSSLRLTLAPAREEH